MFALLAAELALGFVLAQIENLNAIDCQWNLPPIEGGAPAAGRRCADALPGNEGSQLRHLVYLPVDWKPGRRFPVIFEYPGNGGYTNGLGDACDGTLEGCRLGYGLSEGRNFIWVCLPFVDSAARRHALHWWGDRDATVEYCKRAIDRVCEQWGGDRRSLVLAGFSRGAIACNYIGLADDDIANRWRAFVVNSHYDGTIAHGDADSEPAAVGKRLRRLGNRPQLICQEVSVDKTRDLLREHAAAGRFTYLPLPFPNHSADWALKDLPESRAARAWLLRAVDLPAAP